MNVSSKKQPASQGFCSKVEMTHSTVWFHVTNFVFLMFCALTIKVQLISHSRPTYLSLQVFCNQPCNFFTIACIFCCTNLEHLPSSNFGLHNHSSIPDKSVIFLYIMKIFGTKILQIKEKRFNLTMTDTQYAQIYVQMNKFCLKPQYLYGTHNL